MQQQMKFLPMTTPWDIGPKYTYVRDLGAGTYGMVCEAIETESKRRVAIKKFSSIFADAVICQRTLREIEILYCLNHPCIVKPLDIIVRSEAADIYLVMEMAQSDLRKLSKSPIFLEKRQVKFLMYRLLVALNYLHSGGIVHRDLKPGNILINSDCTLKICDFSLSRSMIGLKSSLFDCDMAIRNNPLLNISSNSSSGSIPAVIENEMDEGVESNKTVHCSFSVNFQKGSVPAESRFQSSPPRKPSDAIPDEVPALAAVRPRVPTNVDAQNRTKLCEELKAKKIEERQVLLCKCKESISAFKRELTGHVGTRWYRSPEIILLEKVYSTAVDMWAVGCVFAELLGMIKENVPDLRARRPLFPGTSCFPMSPSYNPTLSIAGLPVSPRDQLNVIVGTKGTPTDSELSFINDPKASNYVRGLQRTEKKRMGELFPREDKTAIDLLEKLLEFNPYFRITAKEALRHKYFAEVRDKTLEYECTQTISLVADPAREEDSLQMLANVVLTRVLARK